MKKSKKVLIALAAVVLVAAAALTALYFNPRIEIYFMEPVDGSSHYIKLAGSTYATLFNLPLPERNRARLTEWNERSGDLAAEMINTYTGEGTHIDCAVSTEDGRMSVTYSGIGVLADGTREQVNRSVTFDFIFNIRKGE